MDSAFYTDSNVDAWCAQRSPKIRWHQEEDLECLDLARAAFTSRTCAVAFEVYEVMYENTYQTASRKGSAMAAEVADYMALSYAIGELGGPRKSRVRRGFETMVRKDRTVGLLDVGLLAVGFSIGFSLLSGKLRKS